MLQGSWTFRSCCLLGLVSWWHFCLATVILLYVLQWLLSWYVLNGVCWCQVFSTWTVKPIWYPSLGLGKILLPIYNIYIYIYIYIYIPGTKSYLSFTKLIYLIIVCWRLALHLLQFWFHLELWLGRLTPFRLFLCASLRQHCSF